MSIFVDVGVHGSCGKSRRNKNTGSGVYGCFEATVVGWASKTGLKMSLARAFITTITNDRVQLFKDFTENHPDLAYLSFGVMYLVFLFDWNVRAGKVNSDAQMVSSILEELRLAGLVKIKNDKWVET